jgi:hypothetical protein
MNLHFFYKTMTAANPPSTPISRTKTQAMNRVLDLIPKGYVFYTSGLVAANKTEALAQKFHDKYGIGCTPAQRITRKRDGKANACLVMYWPENAQTVEWLLVATQGIGLESEAMHRVDVKPRLVWLGYELVRYTTRQKASWTWKRTAEQMRDWYNLLTSQLNPKQMYKVPSTLAVIANQPGFHGLREQSWALCQFARQHGFTDELPHLYFQQKCSHGDRLVLKHTST